MIVIGVDPGAKFTGLVVRDLPDKLCDFIVFTREGSGLDAPDRNYLSTVVEWIRGRLEEYPDAMVAMEGVTKPSGYNTDGERQHISPGSLIGLGAVFGAVMVSFPGVVVVPTAQNGQSPLRAYPRQLVGKTEKTGTGGRLRHCRSAWDVCGAARGVQRIAMADHG